MSSDFLKSPKKNTFHSKYIQNLTVKKKYFLNKRKYKKQLNALNFDSQRINILKKSLKSKFSFQI